MDVSILENILLKLDDVSKNDIVVGVVSKLDFLGFEITENDCDLISFCTKEVDRYIKNFINSKEYFDELEYIYVNKICIEYIDLKNLRGELPTDFIQDSTIKTLVVGDTSTTYDTGMYNSLSTSNVIKLLRESGDRELTVFRKIRW